MFIYKKAHHQALRILACFLFIFGNVSYAQYQSIDEVVTHYSLTTKKDTVDFIILTPDVSDKKPIFLWCQGSQPIPLFVDAGENGYYLLGGGATNFITSELIQKYHVVVISMPKTPLIAKRNQLNSNYAFIPDTAAPHTYSSDFLAADYLDNYVMRANMVLDFLHRQKWVDDKKVIVAGHSQGAKVATKVASFNPSVTQLGLFSPNPMGRIDQYIRSARLDAQLGKISWAEADSIMNSTYDYYAKTNLRDSVINNPTLKTWKSFNETFYDDWLELDIPIYIAYGTADRSADLCDIVPILFLDANKSNLTLKRYLNLEHNFFEVKEDGQTNYEKEHWNEVIAEFNSWLHQK